MAPVLPDEILVKIIKDSIKPYYFRVREDGDLALAYAGLPQVMNLMLVNQMFRQETLSAMIEKFTGNLIVDLTSISEVAKILLDRTDKSILSKLSQGIRLISVSQYDPEPIAQRVQILFEVDLKALLASECTPNLQKIVLTSAKLCDFRSLDYLTKIVEDEGARWHSYLAAGLKDYLDKYAEILDVLKTRKLLLVLNNLYGVQSADVMALISFQGYPDKDSDHGYSLTVSEAWTSKYRDIYETISSLEVRW